MPSLGRGLIKVELNTNFALFLTAVVLIGYTIYCVVKRIKPPKVLLRLLFIGYIGAVVAIMLFPLVLSVYPGQSIPDLEYNLIPFSGMSKTISIFTALAAIACKMPIPFIQDSTPLLPNMRQIP